MIFYVKTGGTYIYHCDFKDYEINELSFDRELNAGKHSFHFSGSQADSVQLLIYLNGSVHGPVAVGSYDS
jgi:hypothetical protein